MSLTIATVLPVDVLQGASPQQGSAASLVQKFAALMDRAPEASATEAGTPSGLGKALLQQDEAMRKSLQDMHALAKAQRLDASDPEMTARQIELIYEISTVQFQFNAGVALAQSGKNGLQTLMRNQ